MHPLRSPLVRTLPDDWRETLDAIAGARGWPTSKDVARLAARVALLSEAYNAGDLAGTRSDDALSARLSFSFARDVPKAAGAVRELVAVGALRLRADRSLKVLDLGAGLGASTWGIASALSARDPSEDGAIEAVCVDDDGGALSVAATIAEARKGLGRPAVTVERVRASIEAGARAARGPFDVVVLGQVLSEIQGEGRVDRHVALLRGALDRLAPDGSLVIVEPALKNRTRHLHQLRDALLAGGQVAVFAPCLHDAACPALADEGAWCHEDLDVDLPAWLQPVAARAGLRWQGLTFSYLVLRKDGLSLRGLAGPSSAVPASALVRVVSAPIVTKGKREVFVCGDLEEGGARVTGRVRARRLDRDESPDNVGFGDAVRGDLLALAPPLLADRPRVGAEQRAAIVTPKGDAAPRRS